MATGRAVASGSPRGGGRRRAARPPDAHGSLQGAEPAGGGDGERARRRYCSRRARRPRRCANISAPSPSRQKLDDPNQSEALAGRGEWYLGTGQPAEATRNLERVLALREQRLGKQHPGARGEPGKLGRAQLALGEPSLAGADARAGIANRGAGASPPRAPRRSSLRACAGVVAERWFSRDRAPTCRRCPR